MNAPVTWDLQEGVALIRMAAGPVNALGPDLRRMLSDALDTALADPAIHAIVLAAEGPVFSAGADLREFALSPAAPGHLPAADADIPDLPTLCDRIEASPKPVIAALQGPALGGGCELALAAHHRIALERAAIGLPEVTLGLIPGAGGTQRAPRLAGAEQALRLMLGNAPFPAAEAMAIGLIDGVVEDDLIGAALALARDIAADGAPPLPTRNRREGFRDPIAYQTAIAAARRAEQHPDQPARARVVDCVEAALLLPTDAGFRFERAAFEDCLASPAAQGLIHVFQAERRAARIPEAEATARPIAKIGVLGAGRMGAGITVALLAAGFEVALVEKDADALVAGLERVAQLHDQAVAAKRMSEAGRDADWARLKGSADPAILADADLVIEAAPEDAALKSAIFAQLGRIAKPGAILASTSAGLPIAPLAAASGRAGDVLGLHFFAPADQIRLIEVTVSPDVAAETTATAFALARRMGRIAVRAEAGDGRLGRRLFSAGLSAVDMLRRTGTGSARIDAALRAYGFALGPYQMASYTGLMPTAPEPGPVAPPTDPEDAEIQNRFLAAMANEGARMIEAGLVARPSDLDLLMVAGYGFPRWRGGPMNTADRLGILALRKRLQDYAEEAPGFWQPREILTELIKSGQRFYQLNR